MGDRGVADGIACQTALPSADQAQVAILGVKKSVGPPVLCAILWIFDVMFR